MNCDRAWVVVVILYCVRVVDVIVEREGRDLSEWVNNSGFRDWY